MWNLAAYMASLPTSSRAPRQSPRPSGPGSSCSGHGWPECIGEGALFRSNSVPETWNSEQRSCRCGPTQPPHRHTDTHTPCAVPGAAHNWSHSSFFISTYLLVEYCILHPLLIILSIMAHYYRYKKNASRFFLYSDSHKTIVVERLLNSNNVIGVTQKIRHSICPVGVQSNLRTQIIFECCHELPVHEMRY